MIWAQTLDGAIGKDGKMPWYLPEDLAYFREKTLNDVVVMGRKTWESFAGPLPERTMVVLSRQEKKVDDSALWFRTPASIVDKFPDCWIIGGAEIYNEFMPYAEKLYVTLIDYDVEADTWAPTIYNEDWQMTNQRRWKVSRTGLVYSFNEFERK